MKCEINSEHVKLSGKTKKTKQQANKQNIIFMSVSSAVLFQHGQVKALCSVLVLVLKIPGGNGWDSLPFRAISILSSAVSWFHLPSLVEVKEKE